MPGKSIRICISSKDMKALIAYLEACILIARHEIISGMDFIITPIGNNGVIKKFILRDRTDRIGNSVKVSHIEAHINEFCWMKKKLEHSYDNRFESKRKNISIRRPAASFYSAYILKAEHASGMIAGIKRIDRIMPVVKKYNEEILKWMV